MGTFKFMEILPLSLSKQLQCEVPFISDVSSITGQLIDFNISQKICGKKNYWTNNNENNFYILGYLGLWLNLD